MKKEFKTTNDLKITVLNGSAFKGFTMFGIGLVFGQFRITALSTDIIISEIRNADHLIDVIEWFDDVMSQTGSAAFRVLACTDEKLRNVLITQHGFGVMNAAGLVKYKPSK